MGHTQYYGPVTPVSLFTLEIYAVLGLERPLQSDGAAHIHHQTSYAPQSTIAPAQLCDTATASANEPPFFVCTFSHL